MATPMSKVGLGQSYVTHSREPCPDNERRPHGPFGVLVRLVVQRVVVGLAREQTQSSPH